MFGFDVSSTLRIEPLESRIAPATFVVTTIKDLTDAAHDTGSLRDAIFKANAAPGPDMLIFQTLAKKPAALTGTIALVDNLPQITDALNISGPFITPGAAPKLTVSGGNAHAIFNLKSSGATSFDVSISGLTITKGLATNGGGIYAAIGGTLSLTDCVISGNTAAAPGGQNAYGGGIAVENTAANLLHVKISGNNALGGAADTSGTGAPAAGGGLFIANGPLTMTDSTVSGNTAISTDGGGKGGGIYALSSNAATQDNLLRVKITGNTAGGGQASGGNLGSDAAGGGVCYGGAGTLSMKDATISGNLAAGGDGSAGDAGVVGDLGDSTTAGGDGTDGGAATDGGNATGGGVWNGSKATLKVQSSTISGNTVTPGSGGNGGAGGNGGRGHLGGNGGLGGDAGAGGVGSGGGIYNGGVLSLDKSTISGNTVNVGNGGKGGAAGRAGAGSYTYQGTLYAGAAGTAGQDGISGASVSGGGVANFGSDVTVQNSTISGNKVTAAAGTRTLDGASAFGGGIYSAADGHLSISDSTISGNTALATNGADGGDGQNGDGGANPGDNGYDGADGTAGGSGGSAKGGGVYSLGTLTIRSSTISGNIVSAGDGGAGGKGGNGGAGGAAHTYQGTHYPAGDGGNGGAGSDAGGGGDSLGAGIYSHGGLAVFSSTISGNTANSGKAGKIGMGGNGGGGYTKGTPGTDGAPADDGRCEGGGIFSSGENLSLSQLTIAKNSAGNGGGISISQDLAAAIHNCTIAANKAAATGGGLFGVLDAANDAINIVSTIIALNTAKLDADANATFNADHDLIQDITGAVFTDVLTIVGKNPMLGPLAVSKGAVLATMLPLKGSPALNAGINPDLLTTDERGGIFPRILGGAIDIGAAEGG